MQKIRTLLLAALLTTGCTLASGAESEAAAEPASPKLRALAASLRAHDETALDSFWKQVKSGNTPLIETLPGAADDALYTWLWQAQPGQVALNVLFNAWMPLRAERGGFDKFTRLGDSNVWYTSYTLPRSAHIRYELISPKGWHASPDRSTYFTMDDVEYETFRDPLNADTAEWNNTVTSHTQGPDATTSPFLKKRDDVPHGMVQTVAAGSRAVQVYTPPGYKKGFHSYGLLLVFDGVQYTTAVPTPAILDNLIAENAIPPLIAVFLESPDRDNEFPPNDAFQKFIGEELVPDLQAHYRLSGDPMRNAVLGSSYGGLAAAYTAFKHPGVFGNAISQSGSFGWSPPVSGAPPLSNLRAGNPDSGWIIKHMAEAPRVKIRFFLDVGTWEGGGMLSSNRLMRSVLTGKGYDVSYHEAPGTHHSYYWMLRLPDALQAALGERRAAKIKAAASESRGLQAPESRASTP